MRIKSLKLFFLINDARVLVNERSFLANSYSFFNTLSECSFRASESLGHREGLTPLTGPQAAEAEAIGIFSGFFCYGFWGPCDLFLPAPHPHVCNVPESGALS